MSKVKLEVHFDKKTMGSFHHTMYLDIINDLMFVGVLGNTFMQKHYLAIDYSSLIVHTSGMTFDKLMS